jgi:hypothetical protein
MVEIEGKKTVMVPVLTVCLCLPYCTRLLSRQYPTHEREGNGFTVHVVRSREITGQGEGGIGGAAV